MPNLRKPKGLILKKGLWNKLCTPCKRYAVRNDVVRDIQIFLCYKCSIILLNKKNKKYSQLKPYKIVIPCYGCSNRFVSKNLGRKYCYNCRPELEVIG